MWQHTATHPVRIMDLALGYNNCGCTLNQLDNKVDPHLCGEHGDVMKLSTSSLFDRDSQEESVAIFGENRFLVLQKQKCISSKVSIT